MTGGWYVWIIDTGRDDGLESCWFMFELLGEGCTGLSCCCCGNEAGATGEGDAGCLEGVSFLVGDLGAPGMPHCEMKERTAERREGGSAFRAENGLANRAGPQFTSRLSRHGGQKSQRTGTALKTAT